MSQHFSPLYDEHKKLGAKLVDFAGWEMPISYPSGTIAEHLATREGAAIFDVSHLGTVRLTGPHALDTLQRSFTNDLMRIAPGRAQYTHLLDSNGFVTDDIIVWWVDEDRFDVMPNASNTVNVRAAIGGADVTAERAVIALQGPTARAVAEKVCPAAAAVPRFAVEIIDWQGVQLVVAGTGYTGEDGIEIAVPSTQAQRLWCDLEEAGATPAGLGARDTLRLEAALPLYGHELGAGITPLQAGLGWVVAWKKPDFRGKPALVAERERGAKRRLLGIAVDGRQPPRQGNAVLLDGQPVGFVTSGNYSPVLGHGIALAYVDQLLATGTEVAVDIRGRSVAGKVTNLPFVNKRHS